MADVPFMCPGCNSKLRAPESLAARGATINCPRCKTPISLAGIAAPVQAVVVDAPAIDDTEPESDRPKTKKKKKPKRFKRSSNSGNATTILMVVLGVVLFGAAVGLAFWFLPIFGKSKLELLADQLVVSFEQMAESMDRIHDRATAEKELPNIRKCINRIADSLEKMLSLQGSDATMPSSITQRYEARMQAVIEKMQKDGKMQNNPEVAMVIAPVFLELQQRMSKLQNQGGNRGGFGFPRFPQR